METGGEEQRMGERERGKERRRERKLSTAELCLSRSHLMRNLDHR